MTRSRGIQEKKQRRVTKEKVQEEEAEKEEEEYDGGGGRRMRRSSSKTGSASRAKKVFSFFLAFWKFIAWSSDWCFFITSFIRDSNCIFVWVFHASCQCFSKQSKLPLTLGSSRSTSTRPPPQGYCCSENCDRFFSRHFLSFNVFNNDFVFLAQFWEWFWEMHFCSLVEMKIAISNNDFFVSQDTC